MFTLFYRPLRFLLFLAVLTFKLTLAGAQTFWQPTATHPYGPKTGLAHTGDSTLVTIVEQGLLRTPDLGRRWALTLHSPRVYAVFSTRGGLLLAGGSGRIYRSHDAGQSWDSVLVATSYPITCFAETPQGGLFAGTGTFDDLQGRYLGQGVLFSPDQGQSWSPRNTGLPNAAAVNNLATDRLGRAYLSTVAEELWQQPGLYRSADQGLSWQQVPLRINGRGAINDDLTAYELTALAVTPQDTLLCSFQGVTGSVAVRLSLKKQLNDLTAPSFWQVAGVNPGPMWWMDRPLQTLHFAGNGHWYSSFITPTPRLGGTLFSVDQGRSWTVIQSGLGFTTTGGYGRQHFAETALGYLYMVQEDDPGVYVTNASLITATRPAPAPQLTLYPSPVSTTVHLTSPGGLPITRLTLTDLHGRLVRTFVSPSVGPALDLNLTAEASGVYLLTATLADGRVLRQRLVKQ